MEENGSGWFHRHVHRVVAFVQENMEKVSSNARKKCIAIEKGFDQAWRGKVIQMQIPLFALTTKGQWGLRFDSFLAQALELWPLHSEEPVIPPALVEQFYTGSLLPCQQAGGFRLGGASAGQLRRILRHYQLRAQVSKQIPETLLERSETGFGLCRYRLSCGLFSIQGHI